MVDPARHARKSSPTWLITGCQPTSSRTSTPKTPSTAGRPQTKEAPGACRRRPTRRILATFTGGELRVRARLSFTFVFLIVAAAVVSGECRAQARAVRAQFTAEGVANCQQPALSNFPIVISGTGTLLPR